MTQQRLLQRPVGDACRSLRHQLGALRIVKAPDEVAVAVYDSRVLGRMPSWICATGSNSGLRLALALGYKRHQRALDEVKAKVGRRSDIV